jgi:hypothetical protein
VRSSSSEPYALVVVPQARRALERLPLAGQDRVLRVLETELASLAPAAEQLQSRGRTYLRTPVGDGLDAIYRPLTAEEAPEHRVPAFAVYALLPGEAER